jgi:hypothetical protein
MTSIDENALKISNKSPFHMNVDFIRTILIKEISRLNNNIQYYVDLYNNSRDKSIPTITGLYYSCISKIVNDIIIDIYRLVIKDDNIINKFLSVYDNTELRESIEYLFISKLQNDLNKYGIEFVVTIV